MDFTDISILHTNDMHSYMENFPKKAQLIANIREGNEKKGIPTYRLASTLRCGALSQTVRIFWSMAELLSQIGSIRL